MNRYIALDVETTGHSPKNGDRVIEIGAVAIEDQIIVDEFSSFIDVNILGGLNNTIINNTRHASSLDAHLGGFFFGCKKRNAPKGASARRCYRWGGYIL